MRQIGGLLGTLAGRARGGVAVTGIANKQAAMSLAGILASPAATIKISCSDSNGSPNGRIKFNASGTSKDSTIYAVRLQ